jgi:lipoprotein-anchoring transpeptidase ErfK/SrfK
MFMNKKNTIFFLIIFSLVIFSCNYKASNEKKREVNYPKLIDVVKKESTPSISDTNNIFDDDEFDPTKDSLSEILNMLENDLKEDSAQLEKIGINDSGVLSKPAEIDTINTFADNTNIKKDSFTNDLNKISVSEIKSLKYNLEQLKLMPRVIPDSITNRTQINARVWARVSKKKQLLELYIDGVLVDSFKVSTGDKKHETPAIDLRPSGPIFNKYTSKKFPGGNYNGLGNMPYVVFVKGGYAIHGTTKGNIPKLGKKASHGCVRLHPDNAKIFNEVVKAIGIENTWVTITEGE